jgi:GNAT superfamily N-acetyltransferase
MRIVPLTVGPLLSSVYLRVLVPSFDRNELLPISAISDGIEGGATSAAAVLDEAGYPHAAIVAEWDDRSRVLLLSYMAVIPGSRGMGVGGRLYEEMMAEWRTAYRPCLIVAEVDRPDCFEVDDAYGDPSARLRFYGRYGARVLDLPYFQPQLTASRSRVYGMVLLALHVDSELRGPDGDSTVAGHALRTFLEDYLAVEEDPKDSGQADALLRALDAPGGVKLLSVERYRNVALATA